MSRATLYVRFPDGSLRYGIYNGTSDVANQDLFDTPNDAWDAWHSVSMWQHDDDADGVPVLIATDYGNGFWWEGTATRDALLSCYSPEESESLGDGLPDWARYP